jgi:transposase InsO family protein
MPGKLPSSSPKDNHKMVSVPIYRIRATDHALLMAVYEHWGSVAVLAESLGLPTFVKERVTPEESAQAGMAYIDRRPSGYWTPKRVMDAVRTRYQQGKSLRPAAMRREDNGLYRAACRAFIRWQLLMKRLEIPKEAYGRERIWTQKRITEKLRAWSAAHGPVNYVALRRDEPALFSAVRRQPDGLKAAGVPFLRPRKQWTKAKIAATLRNRVKRGKPILAKAVAKERQCLYSAALRHFGSWRKALQAAGLLHHSDRGVQYACEDYRRWLQDAGIVCSMSRKGNCYDNAVAESFFSTLKTELVYHEEYVTRAEARQAVFEYVEVFYNRQRRHSSLGYVSPEAFEAALN